ncbi:MAG TPA: hypothetical protein VKT75_10140, partial [Acidobacteriaceae bacterium]|nr:hypothetical protein [Acidobacteriaceae bacterium]
MLQRLAAVLAVISCAVLPLSAQSSGFSLQQVMSAPFCSGLQAAPKGNRILWIADEQGKRNIYVAEPGGSSVHRVTSDNADDGIDVGDITWTPDGENVVYVRGGDFEFPEKPSPNPALLPQGV